ncbi:ATP-binding protein [Peptoniphilus equinus]|uniref:ATP-binding protein n=1 Tax=Peptoniphilus equinus TaxID=3016343 RepID=A0ABY7QTY4_9FIRM|nr:ATP-binding protein [Peptoniphilus equinus]WBW50240.1 ATP-binding protein [Peptoniphilus equinus]
MTTRYTYSGAIQSDISAIKPMVMEVLHGLTGFIDDEDTIFDIRLILDELIVNGAKHGNALDPSKSVKLCVAMDENEIAITVADEGEGFCCDVKNYFYNSLTPSGRGLMLVEALTDRCILNKNTITVYKSL